MEEKINILVVEPGKVPHMATVANTMEAFSRIVGGPIEIGCNLPQRVMLICNSQGKELGLPPNRLHPGGRDYIAGTFFLCSYEGDYFASLPVPQQNTFQTFFKRPGEFMMIGKETMCSTPNGLAEAARTLWENMKHGESVVLTKWGGTESGAPN